MKAEEFDRLFDDGESIIEYLDLTQIKRSNLAPLIKVGRGDQTSNHPTNTLKISQNFFIYKSYYC